MKSIREHVDFNLLLNEFSQRIVTEKLDIPAKLSYAIYKNVNKLDTTVKYYEKKRKEIVDNFSEKDKKGEVIVKDNMPIIKDQEKANKAYMELLELDADIDLYLVDINVESLLEDLEGNHQTLSLLWAILDVLKPSNVKVKEMINA